jgi:hypothetical protein
MMINPDFSGTCTIIVWGWGQLYRIIPALGEKVMSIYLIFAGKMWLYNFTVFSKSPLMKRQSHGPGVNGFY